MRTPILSLSLVVSTALAAQITISEADMPNAGDTLRYRSANPAGLSLDMTGADVVWDYSMLQPQAEAADTAVGVGETPFLYQLFFNNPFLFPQHRADYGMVGAEFDFQVLSLTDVYDYYRADEEGFFNVGFGANVNGLPTSVRREPVDRIHSFPMEFGNTNSSNSSFNVSVPTLLYFGQDQVRDNEVDGWGTLYLPADTFEVLRVKSTLQRTDTIFVDQLGFGFRLPEPETVEYKWLAAGMGKPVLEVITTGGIPISVEFFYEPEDITTTAISLQRRALTAYPNPVAAELFVPIPADVNGRLTVRDVSGRALRTFNVQAGTQQRLDLRELANGTYTIALQGERAVLNTTVVVQH
ncbi:MAG: T9SS type A sorting domain-containing protein [Flavobacteriales bacterium]|nr:T9SS type A sorting domain-containing protein [Flavobacteriales bacterium]